MTVAAGKGDTRVTAHAQRVAELEAALRAGPNKAEAGGDEVARSGGGT